MVLIAMVEFLCNGMQAFVVSEVTYTQPNQLKISNKKRKTLKLAQWQENYNEITKSTTNKLPFGKKLSSKPTKFDTKRTN